MAQDTRVEKDSMGTMHVPQKAYWGAQTQRAAENFPISGYRFGRAFIRALGLIKKAAAETNCELGRLDAERARLIVAASEEVIAGKLDDQFVLDVFQTGSATSTNMNANEVISNRAIEMAGGRIGARDPVHPNDHVNMGQSSNDVIPTAIHVATAESIRSELAPALEVLARTLGSKARAFADIVKIGRTHLQDATPIRLGQEFGGYESQVRHGVARAGQAIEALRELAIGGTAVGTGLNTHPSFAAKVCARLSAATGLEFFEAANHFEAQAAKDAVGEVSGLLRSIATSLTKVAGDLRLLASGPRCGFGEIRLPETQPGSSIMPGKVNPVMCEMVIMVGAQVCGYDLAANLACRESFFELNVGMPLLAFNLLESVRLLTNAARVFSERCVAGIEADTDRCTELVERSLAMCTSLVPHIGYDKAAMIAKEAYRTGRTVREVAAEQGIMGEDELIQALDARSMTQPH